MKRSAFVLIGFAVIFGILLGCLPRASAEEFRYTRENFPRLDGSTSMVPLGQGIASVLLGEYREDVTDLTSFNRTTQSFRNLQAGNCDVVIAAEPKKDVFDEMEAEGFAYRIETIAKEALVFVVNAENPVDSLTWEQVRGIYSGAITNWKAVGGADVEIEAFQRNATAGSQVMMEKLVMEGAPMAEAPSTHVPQEMGELISAVRNYDNSANAIGYTVFYYASDMQMADGLKILSIDGVAPCEATIRSGEYPFVNGYYCCISAQEPEDGSAARLFRWLMSDAGQTLLSQEGYVSVYEPGTAPETGSDVFLDDSRYLPGAAQTAVYTPFDCPKDHLEPSDSYGKIYPYVGGLLFGGWGEDSSEFFSGTVQGFFNHSGQLITDPIYCGIGRRCFGDWIGEDYFWLVSQDGVHYGFVSKDGSVVSELCYEDVYTVDSYVLAIRSVENGVFELYDRDFRRVADQEDFVFDGLRLIPYGGDGKRWCCATAGYYGEDYRYYLTDSTGILMESQTYFYLDEMGRLAICDENWNYHVYDDAMETVYFGEYDTVGMLNWLGNGFWRVTAEDGAVDVITDRNGSLFEWGYQEAYTYQDGCFGVRQGENLKLYDPNGVLLYRDIPANWEYVGERKLFSEDVGDGLILHILPEDLCIDVPDGEFITPLADAYCITCMGEDDWYRRILWKDWVVGPRINDDLIEVSDMERGDPYIIACSEYTVDADRSLLSDDGKVELLRGNGEIEVADGHVTLFGSRSFRCYTLEGELVFCYPNYGMATGD